MGPDAGSLGSILEMTKGGKQKISLVNGEERTFLEDGDTVTVRGVAGKTDGGLVGFGDCVGQVLPSL